MSQEFPNRVSQRINPSKKWRELSCKRPDKNAPIRWNIVHRMRAAIASGHYDTNEKLENAIDRMVMSLLA
jgi:hypothetical protein